MRYATLALLALLSASPLAGDCVFTVNSTADLPEATPGDFVCETAPGNGVCTLRAAVMSADALTLNCRVVIPAGWFTMTRSPDPVIDDASTGDFDISEPMQIQGAGKSRTFLDANGLDRWFQVLPGAALTLSDLTLENGQTASSGGFIDAEGPVTLIRSTLMLGTAVIGGGVSTTASLTLLDSGISSCLATFGGGIYANLEPGETLHVERSGIGLNIASYGGGIMSSGTTELVNSTVAGNSAKVTGGGVFAAPLGVFNCTIHGNVADADADGSGGGGGIATPADAPAILFNSAVADNRVAGVGGPHNDCEGKLVTDGYFNNLVESPTCTVAGSFLEMSFKLSSGSVGGGAAEIVPASDSPVIGAGNPSGCVDAQGAPLMVDQRGAKRPIGARCDIGAIERGPSGDANGDGLVNVSDVFYLINHIFASGPAPRGFANVNGEFLDVSDVFYLINFLFAGGPSPIEPL